jgi:hypothetical protein
MEVEEEVCAQASAVDGGRTAEKNNFDKFVLNRF